MTDRGGNEQSWAWKQRTDGDAQDVAREADVAVSTVSRALSNPDRVSRPMRERVQEVARRLGYTSVRAPVRDSLLALMVSGIANPYNATLIRGVESQTRAAGSR